jgi:HTH-type transcriptional regulator / antitoxin HigA
MEKRAMKNDIRTLPFADWPTSYAALMAVYTPRPLHTDAEYAQAVSYADALAGFPLNADQEDYLEMLAGVIKAYDDRTLKHWPVSSGVEILAYLLEEHGLKGKALAGILNVSPTIAYRIIKGRRRLTADHIKALSEHFGVSADLFLGTSGAGKKRGAVVAA